MLDNQYVTGRVLKAFSGISLPDGVDRIELEKDVLLRRLTLGEIAEMGSHDIFTSSVHDFLGHGVTTCIEKNIKVPAKFSAVSDHLLQERENMNEEASNLMLALHLLKPGRANVFLTSTYVDKTSISFGNSETSHPLNRHPFASFNLETSDIEELLRLYKAIKDCARSEVAIAAARLLDSEHRLSPVDALLDSVIGLEVILNPSDFGELSFRVALNYAFLGEPAQRRERYELIKSVQAVRNKVVHGGLNLNSPNSNLIFEHADVGKSCLRDCLKRFLFDTSLNIGPKLSASFWLDRILPPVEIEQKS